MSEILSDKKLIEHYLRGDEESLEFLVRRYLRPIYSFIYRSVGNISTAEDITQEVFVRVWKNLKKFNPKKDFKPWLFQIARNASIDSLRKKKSFPFSQFENLEGQNILFRTLASSPARLIEKISDKRVLAAILRDLPAEERKIIILRYFEGLSFKQIAHTFGEPINTIKSRHRRIIERLREANQEGVALRF